LTLAVKRYSLYVSIFADVVINELICTYV